MTIKQKDKSKFTDFSIWLNENEKLDSVKCKLDIQNVDYFIHKYGELGKKRIVRIEDKICRMMMIEEKCHMKRQSFAQKDTHSIIDQAMHNMSGKIVKTARGGKYLQYYGYHIISFENTSPENGDIFIDYKKYTKGKLIKFLKFILPENIYANCFLCK